MYGYLKERESRGKFTKGEETKFANIEKKIGELYVSHNTRMVKVNEKETKKQVQDRINALTIEQKTKLLSLLNTEDVITENTETPNEETEEA